MKKDNYKVYIHEFPDGKKYIGITKQTLKARWGINGNGYKTQTKFYFNYKIISSQVAGIQ